MEKQFKSLLKTLKINESSISTVMGGIVILVMGVMAFNYFKSINKGQVTNQAANKTAESNLEGTTKKELPATYKVKRGDDLWHISERYYGSGYNYVDIVKENNIKNGSVISEGLELKIPKVEPRLTAKMKADLATKETVKKESVVVKTEKISIDGGSYKTVKGDHLWSIAVRAYGDGYAWTKIYNANKAKVGKNPSLLFQGVELTLPR